MICRPFVRRELQHAGRRADSLLSHLNQRRHIVQVNIVAKPFPGFTIWFKGDAIRTDYRAGKNGIGADIRTNIDKKIIRPQEMEHE